MIHGIMDEQTDLGCACEHVRESLVLHYVCFTSQIMHGIGLIE